MSSAKAATYAAKVPDSCKGAAAARPTRPAPRQLALWESEPLMRARLLQEQWWIFAKPILAANGNPRDEDAVLLIPSIAYAHARFHRLLREGFRASRSQRLLFELGLPKEPPPGVAEYEELLRGVGERSRVRSTVGGVWGASVATPTPA